MRSRCASFLLAVALMAQAAPRPATAQQIQLDNLPGLPEAEQQDPGQWRTPEPFEPRGRSTQANPQAETEPEPILLPLRPTRAQLGTDPGEYRIQGQFRTAEFSLLLPEAPTGASFTLTAQSAIDVLPERSEIRVSVNGTPIGTVGPNNFDAPHSDVLPVPDGVLRAGRNVVTLDVRHVHRVFCGPDAAFSVWTDIVLAESGVEVMPDALGTDPLSFLAAAGAELGRSRPVTIRTSGASFPIAEAAPVIARVGDIFGGLPPEIMFEEYYTINEGPPQLARVTVVPSGEMAADLPQFRRGGDGAIVLLANSGRYDETGALLLEALPAGETGNWPPLIEPGGPRALSDLGIADIEGRGRYVNEAVPFRLPRNWLLMASQRAELRLDYQYDTDLPDGALLLVKVNGTTIRLLPLDEAEAAGRDLDTLRVPFAANLLHPGINQLSFEALVPGDPPDEACVPRDAPIFRVDSTTELVVPRSPAMSVPDIRRVLEDIRPEGIGMSEAAQASLSLGILPQLAAVYASPRTDPEAAATRPPRLTVGIPSDISSMSGDIVQGNGSRLQEVLLTNVVAQTEQVDAWEGVNADRWWHIFYDVDRAARLPGEIRDWFLSIWRGPESELGAWLDGRAAEAMLIQPDMRTQDPGALWLIVRPGFDPKQVVASLAASHERFEGPTGQVSLFSMETGWSSWHASSRPLGLHEPLTFANARAVVGNYVTITPGRYILPLFTLALFSALVGMGIVLLSRRDRRR
ncbi:cellulose biosynthesis cyclic di-GMP-binding regulatory protein BcsB [Roseivivax sediminis]|uniref:Cyclic di-GMP-binding protein n=1 Tax=Roseivivax sediminis TaxID=936889 RepID=A0A1I1VTA7_9RHOB|nr:cellulose biosynthesis cyclic di-GMP-binding regulatory protein BcsB [Roseivivax sediminis]SFD84283.1 cellulose synthase subunit [Roseivivax sediminis]